MDQSSLLLLSPHTFPLLPCGGSMICRALSALVSAADSMNDFAVLRVISHLFFSFWFLFLTDIFALSQEYFPKEPHIWLWVSAACHVRGLWSQLNSLVSAWDSPSLFPQRPVLLLLIVNTWAQPPHAVSYLPNTAITSRQHYSVQGMDPSALLCMLYCLPIQANRYVRPDKCKEKKIVETAQGSKATDWMVQEHCYFPYFTTTSFSVLRVWIV